MFKKPFVVLDLETSGIDPKRADIIEVALVRYENGCEVARLNELIKISYPIPEVVKAITGITDEELQREGKDKNEVLPRVAELLKDAYLVGHNIPFDMGFLQAANVPMELLGVLDTVPLTQILYPRAASYSLESLSADLGISHEDSHRAMADVQANLSLLEFLWKTMEALPTEALNEIRSAFERSAWEGGAFFEGARGVDGAGMKPLGQAAGWMSEGGVPRPLGIEEVLGDEGAMKQLSESYESRPQQLEMAKNVLNAFETGYHLICEAPTGVGKSLAYLAAAANIALTNQSRVVISTNTITLQDQLYEKDLPLLEKIYREATQHYGVRAAVLKGRRHYLCLRRLADFKRRPRYSTEEVILLAKILVWQTQTATGDSSEIHLTRGENLIWDFELCSDKRFCSPVKCKPFGECYMHKAYALAEQAQIVVVNHALLCSDMQSDGNLLPDYQYLVVDEAHHFETAVTEAFSLDLRQENLMLPLRVLRGNLENAKSQLLEPVVGQMDDLNQSIENFFSVLGLFVNRNVPESAFIEHLLITGQVTAGEEWINLGASMKDLARKLRAFLSQLHVIIEGAADPNAVDEWLQEILRIEEQVVALQLFFDEEHGRHTVIRWITLDHSGIIAIHMAPLLVGPTLKEKLYSKKKSIVLTSATLGVPMRDEHGDAPHPFQYVRQMLGLDEHFEELVLDSPFNYETQTYVLLPSDVLPLTAAKSAEQVSGFFRELIRKTGGGLLGLFTSYGAIEAVYLHLMQHFGKGDAKILAQRLSGGRNKILKAYMQDPEHSVLLGTSSFWEGVDIQGRALTTLVIHKLPFDVPNDPIHSVRGELFQNSFMEYQVPRAILRLRQGFGRLIRSKKDYGVMILLDNRVTTKEYGGYFLRALPANLTLEKRTLAEIPDKVKTWLDLQAS